ncbi:uncharacterized protein G2W53_041939 [Senna tora]|uniref:Uncharacterized protein n=1 Tax=Senna tora TaxID=362788 RepID=A0A834SI88_9FABA|nr:uncharacterized protein G2W53_041939 [Senna tora]
MATMFSGHTIADFHLRSSPPTTMVAGKWHYIKSTSLSVESSPHKNLSPQNPESKPDNSEALFSMFEGILQSPPSFMTTLRPLNKLLGQVHLLLHKAIWEPTKPMPPIMINLDSTLSGKPPIDGLD